MTTAPQKTDHQPGTTGDSTKSPAVLRMARILWVLPFILGLPLFFVVGDLIPNKHGGDASIADGFRRLSVFCTAMFPVTGICWFVALLLTATVQVPALKGWRAVLFWSCVCVIVIFFALVAVLL